VSEIGPSSIWAVVPAETVRRRDLAPTVNISARIRDWPPARRRAVFAALKTDQPDIAELVIRFHKNFGPLQLELDPGTAGRVLGEVE